MGKWAAWTLATAVMVCAADTDVVTDENIRLQAIAAAFPKLSVTLARGKTLDMTQRFPARNFQMVFPDALKAEKVYAVTGPAAPGSEHCAALDVARGNSSNVRELRFRLFQITPTQALLAAQYRFALVNPELDCASIGRLFLLNRAKNSWRVALEFQLDTSHHQAIQGISWEDLTGTGSRKLIVETDGGGSGAFGSALLIFDLARGRFDKLLEVASREMYMREPQTEVFTQTLDVPRTLTQKGQRFCFAKTSYADKGQWFNPPVPTRPCYDAGRPSKP